MLKRKGIYTTQSELFTKVPSELMSNTYYIQNDPEILWVRIHLLDHKYALQKTNWLRSELKCWISSTNILCFSTYYLV